MTAGALSDVVVLELATGVAGPYCGKLLADLGAQVIKVEPPGGDPLRNEYPLVDGESAFFNWLNANKLGVELPYDDRRIIALASKADIIIHDQNGPLADTLDAQLREANVHAVIVSVTPYGRSGDRAGWKASPLTEYATSGFHYIAGDPEREPLALPGYQVEFHGGLHAGIAALAGLWHSRETGEGQVVEVSHQEAALSNHAWLTRRDRYLPDRGRDERPQVHTRSIAVSTHTPGPWKAHFGPTKCEIRAADGSLIAATPIGVYAVNAANAHVLAAAPDLLAACELALAEYGDELADERFREAVARRSEVGAERVARYLALSAAIAKAKEEAA